MKDYLAKTKFGDVFVTPTEYNHIYVTTGRDAGSACYFNFYGSDYSVNAHLFKWSDGKWHIGQEEQNEFEIKGNLYIYRILTRSDIVTSSVRSEVYVELERAITEWALENEKAIIAAKEKYIERAIRQRERVILEMEEAIVEMKEEIASLKRGEHLGTYPRFSVETN